MKNKFKKSKIIVPALALITATTAASVTGTVAWFTATRAVTAQLTTFAAESMDSALEVSATAGVGTVSVEGSSTVRTIAVDGKLTHCSYDAKVAPNGDDGGHLYVANLDSDGTNTTVTSYSDLKNLKNEKGTDTAGAAAETAHSWYAGIKSGSKVWYGVSWTLTFKQQNLSATDKNILMFNPNLSTMTGTGDTINGLRVAIMTKSKVIVVGKDSIKTHVDASTTKDTETLPTFNGTNGTTATYVTAAASINKEVDYSSTIASSLYNFGELDNTNGISITCVAWFEGTNENVQTTGKTLTTDATALLSFYSVKTK